MKINRKKGILLVANWDSDTGYAWWLMESFWVLLSESYNNHRTILAYPSVSRIPENIKKAPIECFKMDFTLIRVKEVLKQCYFIRKNNIRVIYFSDQKYWHWRYLAFYLFGVKIIIVHDHSPGVRAIPVGIKKIFKSIVVKLPGISADAIIGATPYIKQRVIETACFPEKRSYAASNGLPASLPHEPINLYGVFNIPVDRKIMITTGRASHYKGIPFAMNCIIEITKFHNRRDLHWFFCGDGPDLNEFITFAQQNGIEDFITFSGRRNDVFSILGDCHFAFHPSLGEVGYSLSILEYMRAGLPVVVPDNPSVCSVTEDGVTGLIYSEKSIKSACESIVYLLDNDKCVIELGSNARKQSQKYTLDNTHAEFLNAIHSIDLENKTLS